MVSSDPWHCLRRLVQFVHHSPSAQPDNHHNPQAIYRLERTVREVHAGGKGMPLQRSCDGSRTSPVQERLICTPSPRAIAHWGPHKALLWPFQIHTIGRETGERTPKLFVCFENDLACSIGGVSTTLGLTFRGVPSPRARADLENVRTHAFSRTTHGRPNIPVGGMCVSG